MKSSAGLIIFLLAIASGAWADHIPYTIGIPPNNTLFLSLSTEKDWLDWVNYVGDAWMSPYLTIQYLTESEHGVSSRRWKKFSSNFHIVLTQLWDEFKKSYPEPDALENANDVLSRLAEMPVNFELKSTVPLGIFQESSTHYSSLWRSSGSVEMDGETIHNTQYQTSSAVFLNGRIIILFAYMTRENESDAALELIEVQKKQ